MTTVIDKQKNCFVYFKFFACYCYDYDFDHLCYCLLLVFNYFICKYGCHKKRCQLEYNLNKDGGSHSDFSHS